MRRVVFLCIGNACRSQMAEGFARVYGRDVMDAWSAGLYPATAIPEQTIRLMAEKNVPLQHSFPKRLDEVPPPLPELYINMSGLPVPGGQFVETRAWEVKDPYQMSDVVFRQVRDQIEALVMALIMELRTKDRAAAATDGGPAPAANQGTGSTTPSEPRPGRRGWRRGL